MKKALKILTLAMAMNMMSCSSDDTISIDDRSTAIVGQWEYLAITSDRPVDLNGDGQTTTNILESQEIAQCVKDDLILFRDTFNYIVSEKDLACEGFASFEIKETDVWSLSSDKKAVIFQSKPEVWNIIELTNNRFVVEYQEEDFNQNSYTLEITFKKS